MTEQHPRKTVASRGGRRNRFARWLYRGGRPNALARAINGFSAFVFARAPLPASMVQLEVIGRRSGAVIAFPMVVADHGGERYLVSMLGDGTNWLRNVRAAGGRAVLRRRGSAEPIELSDVPVAERAPILRRYLRLAPGARPHIPVRLDAPLAEFEKVAPEIPVLRITTPWATGSLRASDPDR